MFVEFDINGNCIKYGLQEKVNENCLEVGIDIFWKIDIKRNNEISTINVNDMLPGDIVISTYNNPNLIKKTGNTIRLKTNDEKKQEKYIALISKYLNDTKIKAIVDATYRQWSMIGKPGIDQNNIMFTDQECLEWQNFYNALGKDQKDLTSYGLDEINESILNIPEIPEVFKNIIT